jgi:hypothetical protein
VVNSGLDAAALSNGSGQYGYLYTALAGGAQSRTFTRLYFQLSSLASGNVLAIGQPAGGGNVWEVDYDANRKGLDVYFWDSAGNIATVQTQTNVLSANTWYSVEVGDDASSGGVGQVWLNGSLVGSTLPSQAAGNPLARLMLFNAAPGTIYFDDIQVANIYNGPLP